MKLIKIFWRKDCPRCPASKQLGEDLELEGINVSYYNMDTIDGLAEGAFCEVLSLPTILLVDNETDEELESWRGFVPSLKEVKTAHEIML